MFASQAGSGTALKGVHNRGQLQQTLVDVLKGTLRKKGRRAARASDAAKVINESDAIDRGWFSWPVITCFASSPNAFLNPSFNHVSQSN